MKSRYIYCPMTARRIGRRVTLWERIVRDWRRAQKPRADVFPAVGYYPPVYPGK
jgi:hypothetical protein